MIRILSIALLVASAIWLATSPSWEPLVAALAGAIGVASQLGGAPELPRPEPTPDSAARSGERSLLVLPFENLSADADNEYFSDGLTEELIAALGHVASLRVISRYSAMRLKGTGRSLAELAKDLAVDFVVEGAVRKDGNALRITMHLVDAHADRQLWAERYDGTLDDVFGFQESVSREIVGALNLRVESGEAPRTGAPRDARAFEAYLRGRHQMGNWSRESNERALRSFGAALDMIGENALLHAGIGHANFRLAHIVPGEMAAHLQEAEREAARSLELDPRLVTAHVLSGLVDWKKGAIEDALRHWGQALATDADDGDVLTWLSFCGSEVGAFTLVERCILRLAAIDPINPFTRFVEGFAALMAGRLIEAARAIARSLELDPVSPNSIALSAFVELRLGDAGSARERLRPLSAGQDEDVWTHLGLALLAALDGEPFDLPRHVIVDSQKDETFAWWLAECHAVAQRPAETIEWLDHALDTGFANVEFVGSEHSAIPAGAGEADVTDWIARARLRRAPWLAALS